MASGLIENVVLAAAVCGQPKLWREREVKAVGTNVSVVVGIIAD